MTKYFVFFSLLFLSGTSVFLLYHQKNIRCIFIASNKNFIVIEDHVYVSQETPLVFQSEVLSLINYSQQSLQNFWKMSIEVPTVVYCHSEEDYQSLGAENTLALCRLGTYLVISPNGLDHEILTHEMCHAVIFDLIEQNYFQYYTKLPSWLDEGIALQFNTTGDYINEELKRYKQLSIGELKYLDRPHHFYTKNHHITLENYIKAQMEIAQFLQQNDINELKKLLKSMNPKKKFYQTYESLNP